MITKVYKFFFSGLFFFAVALFMLTAMAYFAADTVRFISASVETDGIITGYLEKDESGSDGKLENNFYPVIRYPDASGAYHTFTSDTAMNYEVFIFLKAKESGFKNPLYTVPAIKIRYKTASPDIARAARSAADLWGNVLASGILAVIFTLIGSMFLWFYKKGKRE